MMFQEYKNFISKRVQYLEKGDQEKAWECFKSSCTKADLDTDIGFATYAKVSLALKKIDDAIFAYKKTLELNPKYPEAKFNLANAYYIASQYDKAIGTYQEVLRENPNELRAYYNQGEAYLKINQPQKALDCFNRSEKVRGEMPQLPIRIAACLEKMGKRQQAITRLYDIFNDAKAPENIKKLAKGLIAQMEGPKAKTA